MRTLFRTRHFVALLSFLLPALARAEPPARRCVSILATSDVHGALVPTTVESAGGASACADGVLALSGYVAALRAARPQGVLLVDAGDLFQGTMPVNMSRGRAMIDAYNALGYDASAIGNHEFDYGPDVSADAHARSPTGSLEAAIARAEFPFLAANMDDAISKERPLWKHLAGSTQKTVGGVRVGIIGVSTPSTPSGTLAVNVRDLSFAQAAPRIEREARALRAGGAELVVLLAHMGGRCLRVDDANDLSSCVPASSSLSGELFATLAALPRGTVDVAVGGHTHEKIAHWVDGTAVVQSGAFGRFVGRVDACVADGGGIDRGQSAIHPPQRLCLTTWPDGTCRPGAKASRTVPACYEGRAVEVDPQVAAAVQPYLQAVGEQERRLLGATLPARVGPGALAQWTAEGLRRGVRADFGLQNRGGVRAGLAAGPVRYGDLFRSVPFDNRAVRLLLSGAQVEAVVKAVAKGRSPELWPRLAGLTLRPGAEGLEVRTAKGLPLVPTRMYTFATNEFILAGGDGTAGLFAGVPAHDIEMSPMSLRDSLALMLTTLFHAPAP